MKKDLFLWLRRCQFPLLLLLSVMPIALTSLSVHAPHALISAYILFAAYVLLSGVCLAVPGAKRLPAAIVSSALLLALSFGVLAIRAYPLFLLLPAGLIALLFFSLPLAARRYESDIPPFVYLFGVGIHVVVQFLNHYFSSISGVSPYAPVQSALTGSLIGYILLFLLSMNRISLDNATLARHRLPASMRRFNTVLTLGFLALSLLLSSLPAVVRAIQAIGRVLSAAFARLSAWLLSLFPDVPDMGGGAGGGMMGLPQLAQEEIPQSAFALLMEKIASVLSMLLLAGGTLFLAYLLLRQAYRLCRYAAKRLKQYVSSAATEYDDEITDTREDGAARESRFTRRARRHIAFDATPAGRIRQAYARLLRRRSSWAESSTARENLPEDAAALYERARYSEHPINDADADRFASLTRKA